MKEYIPRTPLLQAQLQPLSLIFTSPRTRVSCLTHATQAFGDLSQHAAGAEQYLSWGRIRAREEQSWNPKA